MSVCFSHINGNEIGPKSGDESLDLFYKNSVLILAETGFDWLVILDPIAPLWSSDP